jgi:hypothetical protein
MNAWQCISRTDIGEETVGRLDVLQAVQFVIVKGKRLAVMSAEDWEALIEWLETTEDIKIAGNAFAKLEAAGGDRQCAGWQRWEDVEAEIG